MTNYLKIVIEIEPSSQSYALEVINAIDKAMQSMGYIEDGTMKTELKCYPSE